MEEELQQWRRNFNNEGGTSTMEEELQQWQT